MKRKERRLVYIHCLYKDKERDRIRRKGGNNGGMKGNVMKNGRWKKERENPQKGVKKLEQESKGIGEDKGMPIGEDKGMPRRKF